MFCLILKGDEGNYEEQLYSLVSNTVRPISSVSSADIVNKLINMIQDGVLLNNKVEITKEIVLISSDAVRKSIYTLGRQALRNLMEW